MDKFSTLAKMHKAGMHKAWPDHFAIVTKRVRKFPGWTWHTMHGFTYLTRNSPNTFESIARFELTEYAYRLKRQRVQYALGLVGWVACLALLINADTLAFWLVSQAADLEDMGAVIQTWGGLHG